MVTLWNIRLADLRRSWRIRYLLMELGRIILSLDWRNKRLYYKKATLPFPPEDKLGI